MEQAEQLLHGRFMTAVDQLSTQRIPLRFSRGFSRHAVIAVMAEKFGLKGLRIAAMIGFMAGYLGWRGCTSFVCTLLYGLIAICLIFFIGVVWAAKESLDKFVGQYQNNAWLIIDESGLGGESLHDRFHFPWENFRRIALRSGFFLLETRQGAWMVLPTTHFTAQSWTLFKQRLANRAPVQTVIVKQ